MNESLKNKENISPPIIELFVDNKPILLNEFTQKIIAILNLSCFELLKGTPTRENIKNFEISLDMQKKIDESTKITILYINEKHVGAKPFIQNMIRGYNVGLILTLQDIPKNAKKYVIKYSISK